MTSVTPSDCPLMSPTITFERLRVLVPVLVMVVIVITAKMPGLDIDWPFPIATQATPVTIPVLLLIVPGIK